MVQFESWTPQSSGLSSIAELFGSRCEQLDARLAESGAILFRGFGVDTPEKFQAAMDSLPVSWLNYIDGNSPRTKLAPFVYTSTEYPAEYRISLHNELSYCNAWPARLYFCCVVAPRTGGSTSIADSAAILQSLSASTVELLERKGVKYVRNLHGGVGVGKSWQQTFETESREQVEAACRSGEIRCEWKRDGGLRLTQVRPATLVHPRVGRRVWFNQLEQFHPSSNPPEVCAALLEMCGGNWFDLPQYACLGDDQPVSDELLAEVRAAMEAQTVEFPWQQGDLLMIDNVLVAHGRAPYTGPRRVLVSMSA